MRFVLPFTGSRGDVSPGLALGAALSAAGHHVNFGAPPNLVAFARSISRESDRFTVTPFGPDTGALLQSDLVRVRIKSNNPRVRIRALGELANVGWAQMTEELSAISAGADAVVTGTLGQEMAFNIAESRSIPFAALHYCPVRGNGVVPLTPGATLPRRVNSAAWSVLETMRWRSMRARENAQRAQLGLRAATHPLPRRIAEYGGLELQTYDALLFPGLDREWDHHRPFVGFLGLPGTIEPDDDDLLAWIESDSPPVYFGFGSMPVEDPDNVIHIITAVCRRLGRRALIASGWSSLQATTESDSNAPDVRVVTSVDHSRIFPLCAAVVHHGGAGTTAAGLRAGRPTFVCWFSADQPFWGSAVTRTGAGASTKFRSLTESALEEGLRRTLADDVARRAAELGSRMTAANDALTHATQLVIDGLR